jgi:6-phosphofructokinase 1
MKVGVLTGGGDCPGLNAVIRAVVRRAVTGHGLDVEGIRHGWRGCSARRSSPSTSAPCRESCRGGGTILGLPGRIHTRSRTGKRSSAGP